MQIFESETPQNEPIFATTVGIREYALEKGKNTESLIEGAIVQATDRIVKMAEHEIKAGASTKEILHKYAARAVSDVTKQHMASGLSIPRVFFGGKYQLEDVIQAASCVDAAAFNKVVLEEGFGLECEIHEARLGVVPGHHYVEVKETGQIVDAVLRGKNNPGGFFPNKEVFQRRLDFINSGGISMVVKQIKGIIRPKEVEESGSENYRNKTPQIETASAEI